MATIVDTLGDGNRRLQLGDEEFTRTFGFRTNWSKVRLGVRMCFTDSGSDIASASILMGICEGPVGFKSADTAGYIGIAPGTTYPTNWAREGANNIYRAAINDTVVTKFGGSISQVNHYIANLSYTVGYLPTYSAMYWFCDFRKSGTNIIVHSYNTYSPMAGGGNRTLNQFYAAMDQENAIASISVYTDVSVAYGSTIDKLDTFSFVWEKAVPKIELSDVMVMRFA